MFPFRVLYDLVKITVFLSDQVSFDIKVLARPNDFKNINLLTYRSHQRLPPGGHPGDPREFVQMHIKLIKSPWIWGRGIQTNPYPLGGGGGKKIRISPVCVQRIRNKTQQLAYLC